MIEFHEISQASEWRATVAPLRMLWLRRTDKGWYGQANTVLIFTMSSAAELEQAQMAFVAKAVEVWPEHADALQVWLDAHNDEQDEEGRAAE